MGTLGFWRLAQSDPDWIAAVDPDGTEHPAGSLAGRVNQLVHGLREAGLTAGDTIAALLPNDTSALEVYLAALQAGWYFVPLNWHFAEPELTHIVTDAEAKAFFAHERFAGQAAGVAGAAGVPAGVRLGYGDIPGFRPVGDMLAGQSTSLPPGRTAGAAMHYTSGTTGRPKAVRRMLPPALDPDDAGEFMSLLLQMFGITPGQPNAHLITSPNYHTAVTQFGGTALHMGHTLVYLDDWDAEQALARVEQYRVTSAHMVPVHFKRLLALPAGTRARYDLSSMRWLIHASAPCPVPIKRAMLDWWGPCVYEYYASTEIGGTLATPQDWLAHPGTVGKPWPMSEVRIVDDSGAECPPGKPGSVYLKVVGPDFEYKGDPAATASKRLDGFITVDDVGYLDSDGFLYLCDRKSDVIISGGVNIYPAEIESEIMAHPEVADVAVFGIPDEEWGEQVKAVVQPAAGQQGSPELAAEIVASLEGRLARMKWPKTISFTSELPRDPNGKLFRRLLRDRYWEGQGRAI